MSTTVSGEGPRPGANITQVSNGQYVTTGVAARALGIHIRTLQTWRNDGLVTPATFTARGMPRWDVEDLRQQVEAVGKATDQRRRNHDDTDEN